MSLEEQLIELQERYCHLEKLTTELNEVLIAHQRTIDLLQARVARLETRLNASGDGQEFPVEKPPHY